MTQVGLGLGLGLGLGDTSTETFNKGTSRQVKFQPQQGKYESLNRQKTHNVQDHQATIG